MRFACLEKQTRCCLWGLGIGGILKRELVKPMYNISRGQMWVIVMGASLFWLFSIAGALDYSPAWWQVTSAILIPFLVIFYVMGWKRHHKQEMFDRTKLQSINLADRISRIRKVAIWLMLLFVVGGALTSAGIFVYDKYYAEPSRMAAEAEEYVGRVNRFAQHVDNALECRDEFVSSRIESRTAECQIRYDKAYSNYKTCRAFDDHTYCLLNWPSANYEAIDCSEEAMTKEIASLDYFCYATAEEEFVKIKIFEESLVDDYLETLPPSKSSLTSDELESLYSTFPQSVFNEKTEQRIRDYLSEKGYKTDGI